jgi:hypothetical protein
MARGYPSLDLFNHNTTTNKDAKFKFINPTPLEITNETLREHPMYCHCFKGLPLYVDGQKIQKRLIEVSARTVPR